VRLFTEPYCSPFKVEFIQKLPHTWSFSIFHLYINETQCPVAKNVREFLARHSNPVVVHLPCSLDMVPFSFFLLPG